MVAGAFEYFLAHPSEQHDDVLAAAFTKYGGMHMGEALRKSARPALARVVLEGETSRVKYPKLLRVGGDTGAERAILW